MKISSGRIEDASTTNVDEIKNYYDCRYLSLCEAVWRSFDFNIYHSWPVVQRLTFSLFKDDDNLDQVFQNNESMKKMFLAWFEVNKKIF